MIKDQIILEAGKLLVSPPLAADPHFYRAVVLLCEHSEKGSFGLVLNRSLTLVMEELFDDLGGFREIIGWGGPVGPETLHFLHRLPELIPGSIELRTGIHWGGDFEAVKRAVAEDLIDPDDIRFFLGYTGWSAGQLSGEVDSVGWLVTEPSADAVFDASESSMWRETMLGEGGSLAVLAGMPEYPALN